MAMRKTLLMYGAPNLSTVGMMVVFALGLFLEGCNESTTAESNLDAQSPPSNSVEAVPALDSVAPLASSDSVVLAGNEQDIASVYGVKIVHPPGSPGTIIITAKGVVPSGAWSNPVLVPEESDDPKGTVRNFKFVALPPVTQDSSPERPVNARLQVDRLPRSLTTIRVSSATNTMSVIVVWP